MESKQGQGIKLCFMKSRS